MVFRTGCIYANMKAIVFFVELWTMNWLQVSQWKHNINQVNRQSKPVCVECGRIMAFFIAPDEHNP